MNTPKYFNTNAFTFASKTRGRVSVTVPGGLSSLLDFDLRPGIAELLRDGLGLGLRHAFLHRLGRTVDQVLGLFQAEACQLADRLDHVHLVVADGIQHYRALRLLLRRGGGRAGAGGRRRHRHRRGGGYAELLFHVLDELRQLEDGHLRNLFQYLRAFHCFSPEIRFLIWHRAGRRGCGRTCPAPRSACAPAWPSAPAAWPSASPAVLRGSAAARAP